MTTAAWMLLSVTWLITLGFTLRFFVMALRTRDRNEED